MLKIRLKPLKNKKSYKIILIRNLTKRNAKSIFEFGYYNPVLKIIKINIKLLYHFLNKGAYPTKTVRNLIYKYINI
jgi:ribosomal protein S16